MVITTPLFICQFINNLRCGIAILVVMVVLVGCREERETKYDNGQVKERYTVIQDKNKCVLWDGKYMCWYENGQAKAKGNIYRRNPTYASVDSSGLPMGGRIGKWIFWYQNGKKEFETTYKRDGQKEGRYTEWYENGKKKVKGNYIDGDWVGRYTEWNENGQKLWEDTYKHDKLESIEEPSVSLPDAQATQRTPDTGDVNISQNKKDSGYILKSISSFIANKINSDESGLVESNNRKIFYGDLNGDGIDDAVVQYVLSPEGGNSWTVCIAAFLIKKDTLVLIKDTIVDGSYKKLNGEPIVEVTGLRNGSLVLNVSCPWFSECDSSLIGEKLLALSPQYPNRDVPFATAFNDFYKTQVSDEDYFVTAIDPIQGTNGDWIWPIIVLKKDGDGGFVPMDRIDKEFLVTLFKCLGNFFVGSDYKAENRDKLEELTGQGSTLILIQTQIGGPRYMLGIQSSAIVMCAASGLSWRTFVYHPDPLYTEEYVN